MEDKDLFILRTQYHGCRCPGSLRRQGFHRRDIDLDCQD